MSKEAFGYVYPSPDKVKYEALMSYVGKLGIGFSRMEKMSSIMSPNPLWKKKIYCLL